jgi:cold shock CspA family protein
MSQQIAERLPSFEERAAGKIEVVAWDQPDPFPWIESTGFTSPRQEPKAKNTGQRTDKMKWYNDAKGFGFTVGGVFVHARNGVSGELRGGARIRFDVKEGGKSPEAVNVRVIG